MVSDGRGVFRGTSTARDGEISKEKIVRNNIDEKVTRGKSFEAISVGNGARRDSL